VEERAGLLPIRRLFVQLAYDPTLFKMQVVFKAIPIDPSVEKLRSVLGGAGTQTVET
jgi:hypothetical protein